MAKKKQTAAQKRVQAAMRKASKQASREGKKGQAYKSRVKSLFKKYYNPPGKKKSSAKKKSGKKSSKSYTKSSSKGNPGGARTPKLGAIFAKIKAAVNYGGGAIGAATGGGDAQQKIYNGIARYTGYHQGEWNVDYCLPTWQGVASTALIQYADARTRHYGNISRMKLLDIAEEALPILTAYSTGGDMAQFANQYNSHTTGYDGRGGFGSYNMQRMWPFLTVKAVRIALDALGARKFINKRLPKGINL